MSYAVKGKPFTYKGVKWVDDCKTSAEVMKEAGLDFEVQKCELVAKMPITVNSVIGGFVHGSDFYRECPNAFATYRTDTNTPLGIVKERYTPVQNTDAFAFFDNAIGKDKAIWQTAGCFDNGARVFVTAKLPNNIVINGDPVENYLVFSTSHDGSSGVKILLTPIRLICENMLNAAIKKASNYISFRHTKSVHGNLDIAGEILGICDNQITMMKDLFVKAAKTEISEKDARETFANIILTEGELENVIATGHTVHQLINRNWEAIQDSKVSMKKVNALCEMNNYYYYGIGQKEIIDTNWGVYNAVTGYYSNCDNSEGTKRMDSLLYGDKSRKIEFANKLLIA